MYTCLISIFKHNKRAMYQFCIFEIMIFFIFKYSDSGLFWSKITIFVIEITLKLLLHTKYGWKNPNWGRLGLKNPQLHSFWHFWQLKIHRKYKHSNKCQAFNFQRKLLLFFEMLLTMSSIRINNNWKYQNLLITARQSL